VVICSRTERVAMADRNEIFETLRSALATMLGLDPAEITMQSSLIEDLGAESLDLLDLTFQIEEAFDVKIDPNEFSRAAAAGLSESELFEADGRTFTPQGLEALRRRMPEIGADKFVLGLDRTRLPRLLTVETFVNLVQRKTE